MRRNPFSARLRTCLATAGLLLGLSGDLAARPYTAGAWSLDVSVVADQPSVVLGEPTWLSFKVQNLSDEGSARGQPAKC